MSSHIPGDMTIPRVPNVSGNEHCRYCCHHPGLVFVGTELWEGVHYEQMGPCPVCELGHRLEFPLGEKSGQWGPRGFWQGRPWDALQPTCNCGEKIKEGRELPDFVREALKRMQSAHELDPGELEEAPRESLIVDAKIAELQPAGEGICDDCQATVRFRVQIGKVTVCRVHATARIRAGFMSGPTKVPQSSPDLELADSLLDVPGEETESLLETVPEEEAESLL